ncbi:3'-5' exonuclease family protein [Denitratisoma sp. agr-D3]
MQAPAFIDVEASGFGSASYPIEVGLVLPNGHSYASLILPQADWTHWDASAEAVHGIKRGWLQQHGRGAEEVAAELNRQLRGMTVYCDSWYHDFNWLSRLFDAAGSAPAFRLEDLRILLNQEESDAWQTTKTQVQREMRLDRHRASNDARVLQATLMRLKGQPLPSLPRPPWSLTQRRPTLVGLGQCSVKPVARPVDGGLAASATGLPETLAHTPERGRGLDAQETPRLGDKPFSWGHAA